MRPLLQRFLEFRRRFRSTKPFTLTGPGWVFILYTVGVGAGAINTGNNLLYLAFGVFLGLIIASGALSDMSLWSLDADCVWPKSVDAGELAMIPVRVTNRKRFLPSICVTLELTGEMGGTTLVGRAYLGYLAAGQTVTLHAVVRPMARGWFQARSVRFRTRYPFGLLNKRWIALEVPAFSGMLDPTVGLFVFPRAAVLNGSAFPRITGGTDPVGSSDRRGEGDSIYGLRDFRDEDSPRRIDWKASLKRTGQDSRAWLVRETERDREREVAMNWSLPALSALSPAQREAAISHARALLDGYAALGHPVRFYVTGADGRQARVAPPFRDSGDSEREFLAVWDPDGNGEAARSYLSAVPAGGAPTDAIDVVAAFLSTLRGAA